MDKYDRNLFAEMARGAKLLFDNAEALYNEAQLLGTQGHFARALCLHQVSMEECSKIDLLGAAVVGMLVGHPIDLEKLSKRMAQHKVKNYNNAYFMSATDAERDARKSGDWATARKLFRLQQEAFHTALNDNKNASLYVDFVEGRFVTPSERVSETLATQTQQMNGFFLNHGSLHVRLLQRFIDEPDLLEGRLKTLLTSFQGLQEIAPAEREDRLMELLETMAGKIPEEKA
jgi:AbiV family abortive infection protein